jgi:RNA recognition motif-containing protein
MHHPKEQMQTYIRDDGTEVPMKLNNKVFLDGLPYEEPATGPSMLDQLRDFCQDWKIGKVMALTKKPGQGFGYLAFRSPHSVEVAVKVLNGRKFLGRSLRVEEPKAPRDPRDGGYTRPDGNNTPYERQVLLSDLSKISEPEVLREVIREYAPTLEPKVHTIKMVGGGRKAFVTLVDVDDVEPFVNFMHGFRLLGRTICAEAAKAPGALPFSRPGSKAIPISHKFDGDDEDDEAAAPAPKAGMSAVEAAMGNLGAISGSNANKKFPMPDMLGVAGAAGTVVEDTKPKKSLKTGDHAPKYDLADQGSKELIVGNVPEDCTAADLKEHFKACGRVAKTEMIVNPHTREPMGLARVTFAIAGQAKHAAKTMDGSRLRGAALRVDREGDDEGGDDNLVVAGPSGIQPLGCVECDTTPAPNKASKKASKLRAAIDDTAIVDTLEEDEKQVATLADRYGVSRKEVRAMLTESEKEKIPDPRDQVKGRADPSKKRKTTKEFIEELVDARVEGKASAGKKAPVEKKSSKKQAVDMDDDVDTSDFVVSSSAVVGADSGIVSFDNEDYGHGAASGDDSDEEVFVDVDERKKKPANKKGGAKKKGGKKK